MSQPSVAVRSSAALARVGPLALALALAGCTHNLDMEAVRKSIADGVAGQLGLPVERVACPPERPVKAGDAFECVATPVGGGRLTVKVSQKDAASNVAWEVVKTEGLLDLAKVEGSIVAGLREQAHVEATAACGGRWKPARKADSFECQAKTADGQSVPIVVTVTDDDGNISWGTR